jgi:hypothetical protein
MTALLDDVFRNANQEVRPREATGKVIGEG